MNVPKINISVIDANRENAMKYAAKKSYGYMKELKPFGDETISEMKSVGFLKTGWTKEEETFGATDNLLKYLKIVFDFEPKRKPLERIKSKIVSVIKSLFY